MTVRYKRREGLGVASRRWRRTLAGSCFAQPFHTLAGLRAGEESINAGRRGRRYK